MKQILSVFPRYLHNDEHDQLHVDFENLIVTETPEKLGITVQYPIYKQAREAEKLALQAEIGSLHTKSITEADGFRDQLDKGLWLFVESQLYHFDTEIQEKAGRVWRILQQYGNIRKQSYNAESSNMSNRNEELRTKYEEDLVALGNGQGKEWLLKQDEANAQFTAHFGERADEISARISGNTLDARLMVDNAFSEITTRINALVVVNGEANYASFIDKTNYYINYHKETLAARKGRKKSEEKVIS